MGGSNAIWSKSIPKMTAPFLHRSHSSILADLFRTLIEPEERLNHFVRIRQNRFSRLPHRPDNRTEQPDLPGNLTVDKRPPSPLCRRQSKPIIILQTAGGLHQLAQSSTLDAFSHVLSIHSLDQSNMSGTVDKPAVGETVCPHHASTQ